MSAAAAWLSRCARFTSVATALTFVADTACLTKLSLTTVQIVSRRCHRPKQGWVSIEKRLCLKMFKVNVFLMLRYTLNTNHWITKAEVVFST